MSRGQPYYVPSETRSISIHSRARRYSRLVLLCFGEARPVVQGIFVLRMVAGFSLAVYASSEASGTGSVADLALLTVSWVCVTSAVYLYNGAQDVAEDRANGSGRPVARGELSVRAAMLGVCLLGVYGLLGVGISEVDLLWAACAMLVIGWMYSGPPLRLKRWPAGLAVTVASFAILTYYSAYTAAGGGASKGPIIVFALVMAGWMALVGQSKDLSDVEGDRLAGRRSLPVVWGEDAARLVISVMALTVGVGSIAGSLFVARIVLPSALVVLIGACAVAALSLGPWGRGDRRRCRRPYKAFMSTQYAAHAFIMVPAWIF